VQPIKYHSVSDNLSRLFKIPADCRRLSSHRPTKRDAIVLSRPVRRCELGVKYVLYDELLLSARWSVELCGGQSVEVTLRCIPMTGRQDAI